MTQSEHVDVAIVGAGWTSAILGWKLGEAGLKVRALEQGQERWTATHFQHNHDALRYTNRKALMADLSRETWTWRPNSSIPALPFRKFASFHPGEGTGGSSVHWASELWRFYPSDFNYRSHHIERYGEDRIPEGSTVQDWPLTYDDLESHYEAYEYDIGVSGLAGNLNGVTVPGGNPFEGARSSPYPLPPLARSIAGLEFEEAAANLGYHPFPQPSGILSESYTGLSGDTRAGCLYCGYCVRYGCEVDAKASALTDHLPAAFATGNYEIQYHSKVLNILVGDDGLARGVRYMDLETGEERDLMADTVILAGYTLTNVRLLLLSQSDAHPDGVGNDRGMVGKNYTYQLSMSPVSGTFSGRRLNTFMGNTVVTTAIHDFNADNFDHSDLDFIGGASVTYGAGMREPITSTTGLGPINSDRWPELEDVSPDMATSPLLISETPSNTSIGVEWGQDWKDNMRENWDSNMSIAIQGESLPYEGQQLDLDPNYNDAFGNPLLRITFDFQENDKRLYAYITQKLVEIMEEMNPDSMSVTEELDDYEMSSYQSTHNTGGAIMGDSPDNSVTNKYGQVWDTPNVFVTGAALFPQNPGMNPTATVLALAYHTGDAMADQYVGNPEELMD